MKSVKENKMKIIKVCFFEKELISFINHWSIFLKGREIQIKKIKDGKGDIAAVQETLKKSKKSWGYNLKTCIPPNWAI